MVDSGGGWWEWRMVVNLDPQIDLRRSSAYFENSFSFLCIDSPETEEHTDTAPELIAGKLPDQWQFATNLTLSTKSSSNSEVAAETVAGVGWRIHTLWDFFFLLGFKDWQEPSPHARAVGFSFKRHVPLHVSE